MTLPPRPAPTVTRRAVVTAPKPPPRIDEASPPTPSGAAPRAVRIRRSDGSAKVLPLRDGERYVLGRHDAADVVFDDDVVSRLHGVIRQSDGGWVYEDYGAVNGSALLRGGRSTAVAPQTPTPLWAGDAVDLGGGPSLELLAEAGVEGEVRARSEAKAPRRGRGGAPVDGSLSVEVSEAARDFAERVRLGARTRAPVFLLGPSGSGKTYTARRIHELSGAPGPFVAINCARLATDASALHSDLLGHVRGAYTGAEAARVGRLFTADGGTLFLDEVESLPPLAQGFLLDVLEGQGDLAPLGATHASRQPPVFRLISASKLPLSQSGLRPDLCERLAEGHLWRVPTLAERADDIPGLLGRFALEQESMLGAPVSLTAAAVRFCCAAQWPGQIRQLRAAVVVLAQLGLAQKRGGEGADLQGPIVLDEADFARHLREREQAFGVAVHASDNAEAAAATRADARRLTRAQLQDALRRSQGNKSEAARSLGVSRNTLQAKLRAFDLDGG